MKIRIQVVSLVYKKNCDLVFMLFSTDVEEF